MSSIADKLTLVNNTKQNIKQVLTNKKIGTINNKFSTYASLIDNAFPIMEGKAPLIPYTKTPTDVYDKLELLQNTKDNIKISLKNKGVDVPDTLKFSKYPDLINDTVYDYASLSLNITQTAGTYKQTDIIEGKGSNSVVCGTAMTLNNNMDLFIMDLDSGEIEFEGKAKLTAEQPYIHLMKVKYESLGHSGDKEAYFSVGSYDGTLTNCKYIMVDKATNKPLSLETGYTYKVYPQNNFLTLRSDSTSFASGTKNFSIKDSASYLNILGLEYSTLKSTMIQNNNFYMSGAIGSTSEYKDVRLPNRIVKDIKNGKYTRLTKGSPVIYKGASALTFYLGSAVDITKDIIKY